MLRIYRLTPLLLALLIVTPSHVGIAQPVQPKETPELQQAALEKPTPTNTPIVDTQLPPNKHSASSPQRIVEPLGVWIRKGPRKKRQKKEEGTIQEVSKAQVGEQETEEEKIIPEELLERYKREEVEVAAPAPMSKKIVLSKKQRRRLERVEKYHKRRLRRQAKLLKKLRRRRTRGDPEIRICSLNLDNYGLPSDVKRIAKGVAKKKYKKKEKQIVKSIVRAACSVVALQSVVGGKQPRAQKGLKRLAKKLEEETPWQWRGFLGNSNHRLAYNAFLVSDNHIKVEARKSFADTALVRFGDFREKSFARGPFEISLRVDNQGRPGSRQVVLMTMHLKERLTGREEEDVPYLMQMTEALRKLVIQRQHEMGGSDQTIYVLLGDRSSSRYSPSNQVLEGRLRMREFLKSGSCSLEERIIEQEKENESRKKGKKSKRKSRRRVKVEQVANCKPGTSYVKILFGLFGETLKRLKITSRVVDGVEQFVLLKPTPKTLRRNKESKLKRTSEIYLFQHDLRFAWKEDYSPGRYAVFSEKIKYIHKDSPLLGIELNW